MNTTAAVAMTATPASAPAVILEGSKVMGMGMGMKANIPYQFYW